MQVNPTPDLRGLTRSVSTCIFPTGVRRGFETVRLAPNELRGLTNARVVRRSRLGIHQRRQCWNPTDNSILAAPLCTCFAHFFRDFRISVRYLRETALILII